MGALKRLFFLIHWVTFIVSVGLIILIGFAIVDSGLEIFNDWWDDDEAVIVTYLIFIPIGVSIIRWILFNELIWLPWKKK
jgi:hypothetical protein